MMRIDRSTKTARWNPTTTVVAGLLIAFLATSTASAREYTAGHKFRRGVSNLTIGVLAIPGQMTAKTREDGYAIGLPLGFVQGLGWFVTTELVGVWELLTCPFEFPPRFRPLIEPEYPWEYFEAGDPGAGLP
jgi:putative exosortase-associated protein (TIGR04073 family)